MHIPQLAPGDGRLQTLKVEHHDVLGVGKLWDPDVLFMATKIPPACPQWFDPINSFTEDCLYLNIFRPGTLASPKLLPVMIWIYGGAFLVGNSWQFGLYDARNIVEHKRVIMVSFNYRLGTLGFLVFPFSAFDHQCTSGNAIPPNLGLLDQIAAIAWVKENIAK